MATDPNSDFRDFVHFVVEQQRQGVPLTPEVALDHWRSVHPIDDESGDDEELIADVQEALDAIAAGHKGKPAEQFMEELRQRFNLK